MQEDKIEWTIEFQLCVLGALCEGFLGSDPAILEAESFHENLRPLAYALRDFRVEYGDWPSRDSLLTIIDRQSSDPSSEYPSRVARLPLPELRWASTEARVELQRQALNQALFQAMESTSEDGPEDWNRLPLLFQKALRVGAETVRPFAYGDDVLARHNGQSPRHRGVTCPTGLPALDFVMDGGLHAGEQGLILGPTKRGKTHVAVWMGAQALLGLSPVLHVTLELRDHQTAQRYDRCLTGWSQTRIENDPQGFKALWESRLPDPSLLRILFAPKKRMSVVGVEEALKKCLDDWGEACTLIVDYGALLSGSGSESRHKELGLIHEAIGTIAQTHEVPIWSPFQANRTALFGDDVQVGKEHASESFEAMQHADVILSLDQTRQQEALGTMTLRLEGARDCGTAAQKVRVDWATSTMSTDAGVRTRGEER